jgi:hypothetical protein
MSAASLAEADGRVCLSVAHRSNVSDYWINLGALRMVAHGDPPDLAGRG